MARVRVFARFVRLIWGKEPTRRSGRCSRPRSSAPLLLGRLGALAYLVYVAIETVLPISAVDTHGIVPWAWA
jgi:hypothetical protein